MILCADFGEQVTSDPERLFRVLRKVPHASVSRQRCTCQPPRRTFGAGSGDENSPSRRFASDGWPKEFLV